MNKHKTTYSEHLQHQVPLHHHNYAAINNERTIAFIRISKNGSTTFCENLNLRRTEHFSTIHDVPCRICCLRHPIQRFLSSIPETIKRINYPGQKIGDVHVSREVSKLLQNSTIIDARSILNLFIDVINEKGFFDSHHEPQVHFLYDSNLNSLVSCKLFSLKRMDNVLLKKGVLRRDIKNSRQESQYSTNPNPKESLKTILSYLGLYKKSQLYKPLETDSFQSKFINQYSPHLPNKMMHSDRFILEKKLQALRTELAQIKPDEQFDLFVHNKYREDFKLYNALLAWEEKNNELMICPESLQKLC